MKRACRLCLLLLALAGCETRKDTEWPDYLKGGGGWEYLGWSTNTPSLAPVTNVVTGPVFKPYPPLP